MKSLFYGTPSLMRFIFRKERISTTIWLGAIFTLSVFVAAFYGAGGTNIVDLWDIPAVIAMLGPLFGDGDIGSVYASSMILTLVIAVGIMNIFLIIRHTRAEEEKSLGEVVRSLPVGRLANLAAVLSFVALTNLAIAVLLTIGLVGFYGFAGAAMFGFAIGASGLAFAGIGAVFANLSSSKDGAVGLSIGVVLVFYMVRAIGDVSAEALSFFSPIGLAAQTQPMAGNIAWPLFVLLALAALFVVLAFYLNSIRDFGLGIFNAKKGNAEGSYLMKSPEGLLFKLTRRSILFWAIGLFGLGASYGVVMGETETFIDMIPGVDDAGAFIILITMMTALFAVVPAMFATLRLGGEEKNGRYEQVFAGSISRYKMMSTHLIFALVQSFVMIFVAMFGLWVTSYAVMESPITFINMLNAFMVYLPAALVMIGLTALVVGLIPKRASLIMFSYFGFSFVLLYFGQMAGLPQEIMYTTPFGFIPQLPVDTVNPWALFALVGVAAALIAGSFFAYRKRDLQFSA